MTDIIEPRTEAGRALLAEWTQDDGDGSLFHWVDPTTILAIEAEAREDTHTINYHHGYMAGRADALREAAERVRALPDDTINGRPIDRLMVNRTAVLRILSESNHD